MTETQKLREALQTEIDTAAMYLTLAELEPNQELAGVYRRLAAAEGRHAENWREKLGAAGEPAPDSPGWRARTLMWMARRMGPGWVLPVLVAQEQEDARRNAGGESVSHSRILGAMARLSHGVEGGTVARLEGRHRAVGGNALRAAVLGANDGLVSNMSLVMGVAGAALESRAILVTGLAGLLAGACSMAMGEWLSVQSSRELNQRQMEIERMELAESPAEEADELALIYRSRGIPAERARELAETIIRDDRNALDTLSREELGIDPEELGGSPWEAAATSFILFCLGAIVPVLPFFFLRGQAAIMVSLGLCCACLLLIGAGITLLTGRSVLLSASRQLAFGLGAAGITYGIGRLVGVGIAG